MGVGLEEVLLFLLGGGDVGGVREVRPLRGPEEDVVLPRHGEDRAAVARCLCVIDAALQVPGELEVGSADEVDGSADRRG